MLTITTSTEDVMEKIMIGLAEAAVELGVPYQDAHRLLLTGKLTGEKRGSRWFVRVADVQRLRASRPAAKPVDPQTEALPAEAIARAHAIARRRREGGGGSPSSSR
jgi:hypothetical protein